MERIEVGEDPGVVGRVRVVVECLGAVDVAHLPGRDGQLHPLVQGEEGVQGSGGVRDAPVRRVGDHPLVADGLAVGAEAERSRGHLRQPVRDQAVQELARLSGAMSSPLATLSGVAYPFTVSARRTSSGVGCADGGAAPAAGAGGATPGPASAGTVAAGPARAPRRGRSARLAGGDRYAELPRPGQQGDRVRHDLDRARDRACEDLAGRAVDRDHVAGGERALRDR